MAMKVTTIRTAILTTAAAAAGATVYYYFYIRNQNKRVMIEKLVDETILLFDQKQCFIKDIALLRGKIQNMINDGAEKVQIVTDFDRTLTKAFVDDQRGHSSYGVIEDSPYMSEAVIQKLNALRDKYHPIEMSTSITEEEKTPLMIEWFTTAMATASTAGIQRRLISAMVREGRAVLRDGSDQFFHIINEKKIPIFIISAGVGDIIEEILHQQCNEIPPHMKIVANFYSYDKDNVVNGVKNHLIHTFNKKTVSRQNEEYFLKNKKRVNVILMGDTLGDPAMSDGIENVKTIIKIGFLNDHVEESLPSYLSAFDVVLTNDANMDIINLFLQKLVNL